MQTVNVATPVVITARHMVVTEAIREFTLKKLQSIHLDYPRIIEAKVVLDVNDKHGKPRHFAEVVLFCANNITIEADSECDDLYKAMDETISKIARRMRKFRTRDLKHKAPGNTSLRDTQAFPQEGYFREEA